MSIFNLDIDNMSLNNDTFIEACKSNNLEIIKKIFPLKEWIFDIEDENDQYKDENALCYCCRFGYFDIVKYICETNLIDVHEKKEEAFTLSIQENHFQISKLLFELYPDIDLQIGDNIPLTLACRFGNLEIVKWLIDISPDIINSKDFKFCFYFACDYGHIEVAKYLFEKKSFEINSFDASYFIIEICRNKQLEVLKWLNEINPNLIDKCFLKNILLRSCVKDNLDLIEYVILSFKKSEIYDESVINRFFLVACENGDLPLVKFLINSYPSIKFLENEECFTESCTSGSIPLAKFLLELKPELNNPENVNHTFINIWSNNKLDMAKWFFELNSRLNLINNISNYGEIERACLNGIIRKGNLEFVKFIESINSESNWSYIIENAFKSACESGQIEIVKFLSPKIELHRPYQQNNDFYDSLFNTCCYSGNSELTEWIYNKFKPTSFCLNETIFENINDLIEEGHLNVVKWLYYKFPGKYSISSRSYFVFSGCDDSEILNFYDWLYEINPNINFEDDIEDLIENHIQSNSLRIIKWLIKKFERYSGEFDYNDLFDSACVTDSLDAARFLFDKTNLEDEEFNIIFLKATFEGYFDIIKWLHRLKPEFYFIENIDFGEYSNKAVDPTKFDLDIFNWFISKNMKSIELSKSLFYYHDFASIDYNYLFSLIDNNKIVMNLETYNRGLVLACMSNNVFLAEEFFKREPKINNHQNINYALGYWNVDILKLFINENNISEIANKKIFTEYCGKESNDKILDYFFGLNFNELCFDTFENFCSFKDISFLKSLYDRFENIRNSKIDDFKRVVITAFNFGQSEIVEWIFEIKPAVNQKIKESIDSILVTCSENNRVDSVFYILNNYEINNVETYNSCFYNFCINNSIDCAEKMLDICPEIKDLINHEKIFLELCNRNYLEPVKYILELKPDLDIRINDDQGFKSLVSIRSYVPFAQFLVNLLPDVYHIEVYGEHIVHWSIKIKIYKEIKIENIKKEKENCVVCGENSDVYTSCNHFYCESCILNWLEKNPTCPYCREELDSENLFKIIQ